jgi:tRNA-binding EMAP/Myf-like protein
MKVLSSWLHQFLDAPVAPEAIADAFDDLGTPVEEETRLGEGLDGIEVVQVLALRPHPNADKIQLVDVDRGDGEALQICCGASNMAVGDKLPLATLGTVMPDGLAIERRKLRGEWSNGMLCSTRELGLGDDHGGIMILDPSLPLGTPLVDALGIEPDVLWELEVNPNRPDAMSVVGLARDVAAKVGVGFRPPNPPAAAGEREPISWASGGVGGRGAAGLADGTTVTVDVADPRGVRPLRGPGAPGRRSRCGVAGLAPAAAHRPGHAPDLRAGRHLQLRDVGAGPAQPPLRPGQGGRCHPGGAPRPRR